MTTLNYNDLYITLNITHANKPVKSLDICIGGITFDVDVNAIILTHKLGINSLSNITDPMFIILYFESQIKELEFLLGDKFNRTYFDINYYVKYIDAGWKFKI